MTKNRDWDCYIKHKNYHSKTWRSFAASLPMYKNNQTTIEKTILIMQIFLLRSLIFFGEWVNDLEYTVEFILTCKETEILLNGVIESFETKCLSIFHHLESILDECEKMKKNQNLMLFPNMSSKILYLFLFGSSEGITELLKKLVWTKTFFLHFCIFTVSMRNSML